MRIAHLCENISGQIISNVEFKTYLVVLSHVFYFHPGKMIQFDVCIFFKLKPPTRCSCHLTVEMDSFHVIMSSVHRSNTIFFMHRSHGRWAKSLNILEGLKLNGNQLQVGLEGRMHHAALRGWQVRNGLEYSREVTNNLQQQQQQKLYYNTNYPPGN